MINPKKLSVITIGTDAELFLKERFSEKLISAVDIVPGTKLMPHYISDDGRAIETDNVSVEFLIPPCKTKEEFISEIQYMLSYVDNHIPSDLTIACLSSGRFEDDQLQSEQSQEFGCDPDFNCWTRKKNKRPKAKDSSLRSNGFHIHIGYADPTDEESYEILKALDLFLGVPASILDPDTDRRLLYGKAGAHRLKSYGPEYRVLSSFFLDSTEKLSFVWDQVQKAIEFLKAGHTVPDEARPLIEQIINNNNKEVLKSLEKLINYDLYTDSYRILAQQLGIHSSEKEVA